MDADSSTTESENNFLIKEESRLTRWWERICLRFNQAPAWESQKWSKVSPFTLCATNKNYMMRVYITSFFFLIWGTLYAVLGDTASMQGELFGMTVLVLSSYLIGWLWLKTTTLPAMVGMLLTGIMFQNLGLVHMSGGYIILNQELRKISLAIILMRAGLGLDANVMKKYYAAILQIGLLPWLTECICIGILSHFLLGLPLIWAFLLGTMIASVSPAVVVPCLFRLREAGYGEDKGIPTLAVAAAAIDDSVSVATFAIILNYMFSAGSATFNIIKGPLSLITGILFGSIWGRMAAVIQEKGDTYLVPLRFLWLFLGALFALFVSSNIGWSGAGPLAVVSSGFVAALFWEKQGWNVNNNPVSEIFRILWIFFEPILFAFTGAQVKINDLDPEVIKMGAVVLITCLVIRLIGTFFLSFGCGLNKKEKLFIGVTWLAKATVQAALGPIAFDIVYNGGTAGGNPEDEEKYARTILTLSVLSIVISAPLGAILIAITGPLLLNTTHTNTCDIQQEIDEVEPEHSTALICSYSLPDTDTSTSTVTGTTNAVAVAKATANVTATATATATATKGSARGTATATAGVTATATATAKATGPGVDYMLKIQATEVTHLGPLSAATASSTATAPSV